ncbi:MAG: hypothetical protein OEM26_04145, partial [Saprospiraceae bacterium]|nr:hypothetical protein [Saprospiraceae bacterium]
MKSRSFLHGLLFCLAFALIQPLYGQEAALASAADQEDAQAVSVFQSLERAEILPMTLKTNT